MSSSTLFNAIIFISLLIVSWFSSVKIYYHNDHCYYVGHRRLSYNSNILSSNLSTMIDSRLKINHFTLLGTHNSYHKQNLFYKYEHSNLDIQLTAGIRQIELDIHLMKNNYVIYHLQLFDDKTNCYCLNECLVRILRWSQNNIRHYPIFLFIEIKQMFYEDLFTGLTGGVKCHHLESIKEQLLEVFSIDSLILSKQIQGNQYSISSALKQQRQYELHGNYTYDGYGWPPFQILFL